MPWYGANRLDITHYNEGLHQPFIVYFRVNCSFPIHSTEFHNMYLSAHHTFCSEHRDLQTYMMTSKQHNMNITTQIVILMQKKILSLPKYPNDSTTQSCNDQHVTVSCRCCNFFCSSEAVQWPFKLNSQRAVSETPRELKFYFVTLVKISIHTCIHKCTLLYLLLRSYCYQHGWLDIWIEWV